MKNGQSLRPIENHITSTNGNLSYDNTILSALPKEYLARMISDLERVELPFGKILYRQEDPIHEVYFPLCGMISITAYDEEGKVAELGAVGKEGVAGIDVLMGVDATPFEFMVQIEGNGLRMKTESFRKHFKENETLHDLLLRFQHMLLVQFGQTAACNSLHTVVKRLATWLLTTRDRIGSNKLKLTQDFLAMMVGVHRPTVTLTAIALQREGLIKYSRGEITILDAEGLETVACECYQTVKQEYNFQ